MSTRNVRFSQRCSSIRCQTAMHLRVDLTEHHAHALENPESRIPNQATFAATASSITASCASCASVALTMIERMADAQGQEAFGSNWQRERSNPSFLRGVVAWMRTLRPLGSGVRERLADISDRVLATEIAKRVKPVLEELVRDLAPVHEALLS
ncbi:hypothetical protein QUF31_21685 [Dickeya chrysanthemi]|uniref:hypothetical protein n=1 Tax=Dickeya chrysanthemi TaxID=556 RepID=UPI0025A142FC|nr:hypothetical protein [Dickeya chrysanthemi]WJM85547.1 hypothetical protein QUF31_21685 [Dickeya chrysanthemi]